MGTKIVTSETKTPGAGAAETALRELLTLIGQRASEQMSDLSGIAAGDIRGISPEIQALIDQTVNAQAETSKTNLESDFAKQRVGLGNFLASKGQSDSSIELGQNVLLAGDQSRALRDIELNRMSKAAEYGISLPFQVINARLGAESALQGRLGGATSVLQSYLNERLGNTSTTQTSKGFDIATLLPLLQDYRG